MSKKLKIVAEIEVMDEVRFQTYPVETWEDGFNIHGAITDWTLNYPDILEVEIIDGENTDTGSQ